MKSFNLSRWAINHGTLVLYLILALAVAGLGAFSTLGRTEDPSFTIKAINVTAFWPGATPRDMRDQVADILTRKIQTLPYFDRVEAYSKAGFLAMQVWMKDSTPPAQVPEVRYQLRKKVADVARELPARLVGPFVDDEFGDVDSVLFAISGDGASYVQLDRVADELRDRLLAAPDTAKVNVYGDQSRKIFIDINQSKLAGLGVSAKDVLDSLAKQNGLPIAGIYDTTTRRIPVEIAGAPADAEQVSEVPFGVGAQSLRLADIADVRSGYEDPARFLVRHKGKPAIVLGVVMANSANLMSFGAETSRIVDAFRSSVPVGIDIEQIADQPAVVKRAMGEFLRSFAEALVIVLGVSLLSLGSRAGLVVVVSVPLVLAITFVGMKFLDIGLQRVSLGALIIALGLLVDDAIIAVEMMLVKMREGLDRFRAACFAWDSTAFPMLTGTLITATGFMPVGFAPSSTGEYTGSMFWVLLIALLASWLVAVLFVPYLGMKLLPTSFAKRPSKHAEEFDRPVYRVLRRVVGWSVDHRTTVILSTVAVFVVAAGGFIAVKKQFFPVSDRPELFIQIRLPEGSSTKASLAAVQEAEALLRREPGDLEYSAYIGQGAPHFWLALNPALPDEAYAEIVVVPKDIAARERVKADIEAAVAAGAIPSARVRVTRFDFGPPVGFPVQFRVLGPDADRLREIAARVREVMRADDDIITPQLDWNDQVPIIRLLIDQDRARQLGLTPDDVAAQIKSALSGQIVTTLRDGIHAVDVVARADAGDRLDIDRLAALVIDTGHGRPVPLSQIAHLAYAQQDPILRQRNRSLVLTVRADVKDGAQAPDVSKRLWTRLEPITSSLPFGYRIEMGGSIEESVKADQSIATVVPAVILIMSTLIMIQLQNFTRFALVLISAPLGVIGASLALNISGAPFGFVALLGMIALAGMDMRNSIILVDQVRQDLERGMGYREAIIGATVRRTRPVVLTSLATIFAMIPLTRSAFWGPMALTISGGLFVATFVTILFLPALYAFWFRRSIEASVQESEASVDACLETLRTAP